MKNLVITAALLLAAVSAFASEPCPDPPDGTCCASPCGKP